MKIVSPILLACVAFLSGPALHAEQKSLYDRLGGLPAITTVVDKAVDRHVADPVTRRTFDGVDLKKLKASIVQQACEATGGPCRYHGKSMPKAHDGLDLTPLEFDTAIGHMTKTLDECGVGEREKNELLDILKSLRNDIVGH